MRIFTHCLYFDSPYGHVTTRKNTLRYYTTKRGRYISFCSCLAAVEVVPMLNEMLSLHRWNSRRLFEVVKDFPDKKSFNFGVIKYQETVSDL